MRSLLALGLLMTLCASASAATVNHSRTLDHVTDGHSQGVASERDWSGYSMYPYNPDSRGGARVTNDSGVVRLARA